MWTSYPRAWAEALLNRLPPELRAPARAIYEPAIARWKHYRLAMTHPPEARRAIEHDIHGGARISGGYFLLLFTSCGIAALGLLQSSAAVVIGAMLISPLMGPILSMGLALARLEPREFRNAAQALAFGAVVSVLASALIVWASPLKDATPEILARTRPTLLDLAVAALSGVVAAYVTITRRGAVIAGVAIATALMPPLAVVGYGIATGSGRIAGGAFLLFATNVVAILGAVFVVARRYGFGPARRTGARWETSALLAAFLVLAAPLGLSLRDIVIEARETHRVHAAIDAAFKDQRPRITDLSVKITRGRASDVQAVVVTRKFMQDAQTAVSGALGGGAAVNLEQIVAAKGEPPAALTGGALANRALAAVAPVERGPEARLRDMLKGVAEVLAIRRDVNGITAAIRLTRPGSLDDYQVLEGATDRLFPAMVVRLVPPVADPPPILFGAGRTTLGADGERAVQTIYWAFTRWGVTAAKVEGSASPGGRRGPTRRDRALAAARAASVAKALKDLGLAQVETTSTVPDRAGQDAASLQRAIVRPLGAAPLATPASGAQGVPAN